MKQKYRDKKNFHQSEFPCLQDIDVLIVYQDMDFHTISVCYIIQVFELMREQLWYRPNSDIYIKLIVMLGKCKQPEKAHELFQDMIDEGCIIDHGVYTALLSAYSRSCQFDEAFSLLEYMKNSTDCRPDVYTYSILIKSCLQVFAFDKVQMLLSDMVSQGIRPNTVTYNTLIDAYGKAGKYVGSISYLVFIVITDGFCGYILVVLAINLYNMIIALFIYFLILFFLPKCIAVFTPRTVIPNSRLPLLLLLLIIIMKEKFRSKTGSK